MPVVLDASGSSDDFGIYSYEWNYDAPPTPWDYAGAFFSPDRTAVQGSGSWGARYLVTQNTFDRVDGESYTGR